VVENAIFLGELSLDGSVRHVKGIMPMIHTAQQAGYQYVYVPAVDAAEASLVEGLQIIPVDSLGQLVEHLYNLNPIQPYLPPPKSYDETPQMPDGLVDFSAVKGQQHVKRALEIAAGGNHNVRLIGPPGTGKTLLARATPGILPELSYEEALEVKRIYSVSD